MCQNRMISLFAPDPPTPGRSISPRTCLLTLQLYAVHHDNDTDYFPAGLPRLLVDVRHEASHNDMPSLSLLRLAAAQALDWLQAAYWQRQAAHLHQQQHRVIHLLKASTWRL